MSYTKFIYHIVTATKNRQPLLKGAVEEMAYSVLRAAAKDANGEIQFIGGIEDHVHAVADIHQTVAVCDFVRDIKAESSKAVGREFPDLGFEWQIGYGAFTISHYDMGDVVDYVLNQKERHAKKMLRPRFEKMSS